MSKSIKKNYIYNLSYQVISVLAPLITAPYLARTLGPSSIGYYSYISSIVVYFTVFAGLGTFVVGQREIAYSQCDIQKRTKTFIDIALLRTILTSVVLIIYILFLFYNKLPLIYYAQILALVNIALDSTWFFIGLEDFSTIVTRQFITKLLLIVLIVLLVKKPEDVLVYSIIPHAVCLICYLSYLPSILSKIDIKYKCNNNPFLYLKDSIILFLPYIATTINTHFDRIMIGIYDVTKQQNGYYEEAYKIVSILLLIITVIGNTLMPRVSSLYKSNKKELVNHYMLRSYQYTFMISLPMSLGLICVASNIVPWFLGYSFFSSVKILMILSLVLIFTGISYITGYQYLISTGKQKEYTIIVTLGALFNVILNIVLIPKYYAIGAAIATVLSEMLVAIIELTIVKNDISIVSIIMSIWKYVLASIIMFCVVWNLSNMMYASIVNTSVLFLTGLLVYSLILCVLKEQLFYDIINMLMHKAKYIIKK